MHKTSTLTLTCQGFSGRSLQLIVSPKKTYRSHRFHQRLEVSASLDQTRRNTTEIQLKYTSEFAAYVQLV